MVDQDELFNVVMFFPDDISHYERRNVGPQEAAQVAFGCTRRPAVHLGIIRRVIITDSMDRTCFDWRVGEGVVFPTQEQVMFGDVKE